MTIIRDGSTPMEPTAIPDPSADAGSQFALSSSTVARICAQPCSGTRIETCPIRGSGSGVRFAEGGAQGGALRPGFR
jgi:hypothetical protein